MKSPQRLFSVFSTVVLAVSALVLLNRCGMEKAEAPSGTFRSVFQAFETSNCMECHKPTGSATLEDGVQLDFSTASAAFTGLTSKTVSGNSSVGICGGVPLVTANDLSKSYFAAVLFADVSSSDFGGKAGCTPYANHHSDVNLSAAQTTSIKAWINNGAPND